MKKLLILTTLLAANLASAATPALRPVIGCSLLDANDIRRFNIKSFTVSDKLDGTGVLILNTSTHQGVNSQLLSNLVYPDVELSFSSTDVTVSSSIILPDGETPANFSLSVKLYEERVKILNVDGYQVQLRCYGQK